MIDNRTTLLSVIAPDGSLSAFNFDALHNAVLRAFVASGNPELYLAEDIALAVEFAMNETARAEKLFTRGEIDAVVATVLEHAAMPEVARAYRDANAALHIAFDAEKQNVSALLNRHLGLTDAMLDSVTAEVLAAVAELNIVSAAPGLYLELARHFEQRAATRLPPPVPPIALPTVSGQFLRTAAEVAAVAAPAAAWLEAGAIRLNGISRLFPCFRINLALRRLAAMAELTSPVTEMQMAAPLYRVGGIIGDLHGTLSAQLRLHLPIYITVGDTPEFARFDMEAVWPEAADAVGTMLTTLADGVGKPLAKLKY